MNRKQFGLYKDKLAMTEAVAYVARTGKPARVVYGAFLLEIEPRRWNRLLNKIGIKQTNIAMVKIKGENK